MYLLNKVKPVFFGSKVKYIYKLQACFKKKSLDAGVLQQPKIESNIHQRKKNIVLTKTQNLYESKHECFGGKSTRLEAQLGAA